MIMIFRFFECGIMVLNINKDWESYGWWIVEEELFKLFLWVIIYFFELVKCILGLRSCFGEI